MKRFTLLSISIVCVLACYAAELSDTLLNVTNPKTVTLVERNDTITLNVLGSSDDDSYNYTYERAVSKSDDVLISENKSSWDFMPFVSQKREKNIITAFGFLLGFETAVNAPSGLNLKMTKSTEIAFKAINYEYRPWLNSVSFSVGLLLKWNNYKMTGHNKFETDYEGNVSIATYPEGAHIKYSSIKTFALTVPALVNVSLGDKFGLSVGPMINFVTYGRIETKYKLEGEKKDIKEFNKHIHHNPVTFDLFAKVSYNGYGVYVKYTPSNILDKEYGPKFSSLSTGVSLWF